MIRVPTVVANKKNNNKRWNQIILKKENIPLLYVTRVSNIVQKTLTPKTPKKNTSIKYLIVIISTNLTLKMNAFNYPYTI